MKLKSILYIASLVVASVIVSCTDDDSFSTSPSHRLSFSTDTLKLDTVFSTVPSATQTFWVYNRSGDGIRCSSVRLERGNQTGFRVNVDGTYLGSSSGFQTQDVEIRDKDSVRVFVEVTTAYTHENLPQKIEDKLLFTLESGVVQEVVLNAYSWDAELVRNVVVSRDSTINTTKPLVVYGGLTVNEGATLTIPAGTTLYFHADAGLNVYGKLLMEGTAENNIVLRGDRIDRMFDYLPYDYVSGQWQGIHFYEKSYDNELAYVDIHSTFNGIICDSADVQQTKLKLYNSTIHNCQGYGLMAQNCKLDLRNCQITNTLHDCARFEGGDVSVNNCTLAQFYPFDSNRGVAIYFNNRYPLERLECLNSLITGYAEDVLMGERVNEEKANNYLFDHCVIRTPEITTEEAMYFTNVVYEDVKDTARTGTRHFVKIDTGNLRYDFRLREVTPAIGAANPLTSLPTDRNGLARDEEPDAGAFERMESEN